MIQIKSKILYQIIKFTKYLASGMAEGGEYFHHLLALNNKEL